MKWTKKQIKRELKKAYEAPETERKQEFLRQYQSPYISTMQFMRWQLCYIKKWVWVISGFIFLAGAGCSVYMEKEAVWMVSALIPFLALTIMIENAKSTAYRMGELEYTTRFSLKNLLLARMGALAVLHGVVLIGTIPLCVAGSSLSIFLGGLYILIPYFLTVYIGLFLLRRFRGKEIFYAGISIAIFISFFMSISRYAIPFLYSEEMGKWWLAALLLVMLAIAREGAFFFRQTEELAWN